MASLRALLVVALSGLLLATSCDPYGASAARTPVDLPSSSTDLDELPPKSDTYDSAPTAGGVLGGVAASKMEDLVVRALHDHGDGDVKGDGRLALLATWASRRAARGVKTDQAMIDAVACRVGFVGPTPWITTYGFANDGDAAKADLHLRKALADNPHDSRFNRYGVSSIGHGQVDVVSVVLASLDLRLRPFKKRVAVNEEIELEGTVASGFTGADLALTLPSGKVRTWHWKGRDVSSPMKFAQPGIHRVEIEGTGPSGPRVLANFPVYVGVDEPAPSVPDVVETDHTPRAPLGTPEEIDARALALLNGARADAHLAPLKRDKSLAAVALAHSEDMVAHGFVGHVSPTTGTAEDRVRRAHLRYPLFGENIARGVSPEGAHKGLMDSPGHRANMLNPQYTHVGVGTVVESSDPKNPAFTLTMEFARERPITLDEVPARVTELLSLPRLQHGLGALRQDDQLTDAARAAIAVLKDRPDATNDAMQAALAPLKKTNGGICGQLVDAQDVWGFPLLPMARDPNAEKVGIAALPDPDGPESFRVVVLGRAKAGKQLNCE